MELSPSGGAANSAATQEFPSIYGTRRFITVFTRALHYCLSTKFRRDKYFLYINYINIPSIFRTIKSRRMRSEGHVARIGTRGMHIGYWWERIKKETTGKTKV
jgi:hypothetical protein